MRPYAVLIIALGASAAQGCLFQKKKPAPVAPVAAPAPAPAPAPPPVPVEQWSTLVVESFELP